MERIIKFRAWAESSRTMFLITDLNFRENTWHGRWIDGEGAIALNQPITNLMQYTGLKDKNGKESFWDDIVSDGINPPFVITPDYHLLARLSEIEFEVIGNIWENPELLEVK